MLPAMATKARIAIVGAGRLGTALARRLKRAGYTITEIIHHRSVAKQPTRLLARKVRAHLSPIADAQLNANVIWFCVPDREIAEAARALVNHRDWMGTIAFHSSGALTSSELDVLRQRGASVASVHPLMTFVAGTVSSLQGVSFALEGDSRALRIGKKIARDLGGEPFHVKAGNKVAYHAWGAFISPLLVALLVNAEQVARAAGISAPQARKKMLPILRQTIENYRRLGPAGAFSGPLVRGDAEIVRKHLQVLRKIPGARKVYIELAETALRQLPVENPQNIKRALKFENH
jgi:predicted short-subunit dehydrogenase-like oxidoreductase (DUF2520 family)